ncbi:MAG: hypothetical protein NTV17_04260 [Burkholderiales bacterium]|nr:hypothetical protein [Burkholderiales bacterium]
MRFLHTSDWHLGRVFYNLSLIEDQAWVLDRLVKLAIDERVDAVLIARCSMTCCQGWCLALAFRWC